MATSYELSFFETDENLTGTTFIYGFDALTENDVKIIGYTGATQTDLSGTIATVNTSTKTMTLTVAPSSYDKIRIFRATTVLPLIEFTSGAVLSEDGLNTAYRHSLFAAQEVSQDASDSANRSVIYSYDINNYAVTTDKIAADAVNATKIADNAILNEHLSTGSVNTDELATSAVTAPKIASDAVITSKILDGNVTAAKLATTLDLTSKTLIIPSAISPFSRQFMYIAEEFSNTTSAAAVGSSNLTQIRSLNTLIENSLTGASFNAGTYQVTLPAGKYFFEFYAPAYKVNGHVCYIYQTSPAPAATIGNGVNAYTSTGDGSQTASHGTSVYTFSASSNIIELRHFTAGNTTGSSLGLPVGLTGRNERYAWLKIWKVA